MNHVYQLIWNDLTATYVATPERTRSRGKRSRAAKALAVAVTLGAFTQAYAAPTGGQISAGTGNINQSGAVTTITQGTQKLAINWNSFNVAANETVNFVQPNSSAIALNRVLGTDGSQILGKLNANGQVFILNPNGVLFGSGSQVNVGGLIASTLQLSDANFLAGKYTFSGNGGSVINQGQISAADGGYVALIGNQVSNQGTIIAKLGTVALAAGNQVMLDFAGDGLLNLTVDQAAVNALVTNKGLIQADGGYALMTAHAKDALLNTVVNNEGIIQARTVENHNGVIKLLGNMDSGVVKVSGTLDASAPNGGDGGFIDTSGAHVVIDPSVKVTTLAAKGTTGTWLIDPNDYTIAASGGDITGALLSSQLGSNNISILSSSGGTSGNGDILVNDTVSWSANTTLSLSAYRNIEVNSDITATGNTAGLALTPGTGTTGSYNLNKGAKITLSGSTPSLAIAGQAYTVINDVNALQAMTSNLAGYYALGSDIDASATSGWNGGAGFNPVGSITYLGYLPDQYKFTGRLDGLNHTISSLVINRPSDYYVGLFAYASSTIQNVGIVGGSVRGDGDVGGLAGICYSCTVRNSYYQGSVIGVGAVGGLLGLNDGGTVNNSFTFGSVVGSSAGGLVGQHVGNTAVINNSYSTSSVTGNDRLGGLAGFSSLGPTISNSYSTGLVSASTSLYVGGLVGYVHTSAITNSYWDTQTSGQATSAGGAGLTSAQIKQQANFSGWDFTNTWRIYEGNTAPLLKSFLTPLAVTADNVSKIYDGNAWAAPLTNVSYSVSGANTSGHLFNVNTPYGSGSGKNAGSYVPKLYSDQLGYDISTAGGALTVTQAPLQVTANNSSKTYGDTKSFTGSEFGSSGLQGGETIGSVSLTSSGAVATASVAGGPYAISPGGATGGTFNLANYNISYVNGTLTITPADITVSANNKSREYGDANVLTATVTGLRAGDTNSVVTGLNTAATSSSGIGSYAIDASAASAGTNYLITSTSDGTLAVAPAPLTIRADDKTKVQTQPNPPLTATFGGFKLGQDQSVLGGALALNTTAETNSPAGNFPIMASGLTSTNYAISFVDGSLKVISVTNPSIPGAPEHGYSGAVDNAHGGNPNHHGEGENGRHKGNAYAFGKSKDKDRDEHSGNEDRNEGSSRNFEQRSRMQLSGLPIALEGSGVHLPVVAGKRGE